MFNRNIFSSCFDNYLIGALKITLQKRNVRKCRSVVDVDDSVVFFKSHTANDDNHNDDADDNADVVLRWQTCSSSQRRTHDEKRTSESSYSAKCAHAKGKQT